MNIVIDNEFKPLIPPLQPEERQLHTAIRQARRAA